MYSSEEDEEEEEGTLHFPCKYEGQLPLHMNHLTMLVVWQALITSRA